MSIDLVSAARRRLQKLNNKQNDVFFKPSEDKPVIRIVPNAASPENPFQELYFHYIGNTPILSPISYGEEDPIENFYRNLVKGGKLPKEQWQEAREFKAQMRTYAPIIVRGKESEGIKFWSFGKTVYAKLLEIIANPDYGDITDISTGRDLTIIFTPKEKTAGKTFPETDILMKPNASPLHPDPAVVNRLLTEQPVLLDLFDRHTFDGLTKLLQQHLENPFEATTEEVAPVAESLPEQTSSPAIDEEFEKLFNK
jgi:hypothetical protein